MNPSPLAQADLFDDTDEDYGPLAAASTDPSGSFPAPAAGARLRSGKRGPVLDEHDDDRVMRRLDEDDLAAELRFLEREVYLREVELRRDVLTAYERYRPA